MADLQMKPDPKQPNMTNGPSLLLRHGQKFSARSCMMRACQHTQEMAQHIRHYTQTIEKDMDYTSSNQPIRDRRHA